MAWHTKKLGEVCSLIKRGIAPKYVESAGIAVINQKCIRDHQINMDPSRRHNHELKAVNPERIVQFGDVLVNSTGTGTLGRVAQMRQHPEEPTTVDTHVTIVRPAPGRFYEPFFGYMMIRIEDELIASGEGASGQTELSRSKLEDQFEVSFPDSIDEQKRIVAILDQAFEGIDKAIDNTEQNLKNARELFEAELAKIFSVGSSIWPKYKVEDICESIVDCLNRTAPTTDQPTPYKMIRTPNIRNGRVNIESVKYVDGETYQTWTRRQVPAFGDVLLTREAPLGEVGKIDFNDHVFLGQRIVSYRANTTVLDPDFLAFSFRSKFLQDQIRHKGSGATVQHMRVPDSKVLQIPLPTLEEQKSIASRLAKQESACAALKDQFTRKLEQLLALKQSLLQKAFSGELTTATVQEAVKVA